MVLFDDLTFLAAPDAVADWRTIVLVDAAIDAGVLAALPGTVDDVARRAGTDTTATGVVLQALEVWDVVVPDDAGAYHLGPRAPAEGEDAVIHQHADVIRRWAGVLGARLAGRRQEPREERTRSETARWLDSLGHRARRRAPAIVDACLDAVPGATSVLDLGGGHGEYAREFARRGLDVTMQDLPVVIDIARDVGRLEAAGVSLFAGSFFETMPDRTFDLTLLAGVAHAYPTEDLGSLYARVRGVTNTALVVSAAIRDGRPRSALFAVQMLSGRQGADIHTVDDHRACLESAGFRRVDLQPMPDGERDLLVARV